MRLPVDELTLVARLRGTTLHVVKCVTNDIRLPADAEYIIEGYLDERGHAEPEGPYGEFLGYYGVVKRNPVFHCIRNYPADAPFSDIDDIASK